MTTHAPLSPTPRSTPTRLRERARADRADLYAVLDDGLLCHLGLVRDGAPLVLPMGYGRIGDTLYLHASTGAGYVRALDGAAVCVTVSHVDGIVYARSAMHHSMNYRSAVVHGTARVVTDPDERRAALQSVTDQLAPGSWDYTRQPDRKELAATAVLAIELAEASVKIRSAPPQDDEGDLATPRWAGVLPVRQVFGTPEPSPDLVTEVPVPPHVAQR